MIGLLQAIHVRGRLAGASVTGAAPVQPDAASGASLKELRASRRTSGRSSSRARRARAARSGGARRRRRAGRRARPVRRALSAYDLDGARSLLYVVDGARRASEDEQALRLAIAKGVRAVCVLVGADGRGAARPLRPRHRRRPVAAGEPLPSTASPSGSPIGRRRGYLLAARLPVASARVVEQIVKRSRGRTASSAPRSSCRAPTCRC